LVQTSLRWERDYGCCRKVSKRAVVGLATQEFRRRGETNTRRVVAIGNGQAATETNLKETKKITRGKK